MRTTVWGALALLLVAAGCASDRGTDPSSAGVGDGSTTQPSPGSTSDEDSSPFTVDRPSGMTLVTAGVGNQPQEWGSDSVGSTTPTVVLRREGGSDGSEIVVRLTGFEGYQGGFDSLAWGTKARPADERAVGHDRARFVADHDGVPATLAVERGNDLAVLVTGSEATRDELVAVAEATDVSAGRAMAPVVEPPRGFDVLGTADAEGVLAMQAFVAVPGSAGASVPGGSATHALGWSDPSGGATVAVLAVPARALSAEVAPFLIDAGARDELTVERSEVAGREALRIERHWVGEESSERILVTTAAWGDRLVLVAPNSQGRGVGFGRLEALAASASEVGDGEWEAQVEAAELGP